MDWDAIARDRRRRDAEEALRFERDRELALREQIEETVLDEERERIDRAALAGLDEIDAALVREILIGEPDADEPEDEWDDALVDFEDSFDGEDDDDVEPEQDEVERLLGEIADSHARQRALERFIEALATPPVETDADAEV